MSYAERFRSRADEAALTGAEVGNLRLLAQRTAIALADPGARDAPERWRPLLAEGTGPLEADPEFFRAFFASYWIAGTGFGFALSWRGWELDTFEVSLNTALAIGGDSMRLAALLAGLDREPLVVAGSDRLRLAGVVAQGLAVRHYQRGVGWEKAAELLRAGTDTPVVVTGGAVGVLKRGETVGRLDPATWGERYFGEGLSVLDLIAPDREDRLDPALGFATNTAGANASTRVEDGAR